MSHSTERLTAALDGRYRIERQLGAGGMATVYLAHDVKHDRKVAVKVLKPELAAVLGAERFVVEIRTTAALQHPHILPLFDSGEADGFLYYVMPFIDGETLRDRLNRESQLGVDEAVRMTCDIADALHYAHQHGVIHRDIKPENILLQNGRPMVADFGIALAVSAAAGGRMTETGLSLGTPHYMSPEQATAEKEITARSDVYSLASVLYEMLTGNPPHTGSTAQQIIMKIITEQAQDVTSLRKTVPQHVADAVAQALEKLPADRFGSAAEFAAALQGGGGTRAQAGSRTTARRAVAAQGSTRWRTIALAAAAAAVVATAAALWAMQRTPQAERVEFTYRPILSRNDRPFVSISRDGRQILEVVRDSNGLDLVAMRSLGSATMQPVQGTAGARDPRFSLDGQWILFQSEGKMKRVPVGGGPASVVMEAGVNAGFIEHPDGSLIYSSLTTGLVRLSPGGVTADTLTSISAAEREFAHWYPQVLPGGDALIYTSYRSPVDASRIEALNLKTGARSVLATNAIHGKFVAPDILLFARSAAVFAQRFDPKTLRTLGEAVPVVEDVAWTQTDGVAAYDVSANGTLVYVKGSEASVARQVVWSDRSGRTTPLLPEAGSWSEPRLSPDGRWIALTRTAPTRQIWLYDNGRAVLTQLTRFTDGVAFSPVWAWDSKSLIIAREVPQYNIHRQPIDGRPDEELVNTKYDKVPTAISRDGRQVFYYEVIADARLTVATVGDTASRKFNTGSDAFNADLTPDGRWIVHDESDRAGNSAVYVRLADGTGGRRQVSSDGGDQPRFTRAGREIVYRKGDAMYAASFNPMTGEIGTPVQLFRVKDGGRLAGGRTRGYDVSPDGQRFLLVTPVERPGAAPNVVITNWIEELERKLPR